MITMTNLTDDAHSTDNTITEAEAKEIDDAYKEVCPQTIFHKPSITLPHPPKEKPSHHFPADRNRILDSFENWGKGKERNL